MNLPPKFLSTALSISSLLFSQFAFAQATAGNPKLLNDENTWKTMEMKIMVGGSIGDHTQNATSVVPVAQLTIENAPAEFFTMPAHADISLGYTPTNFLRMRYIFSPNSTRGADQKVFFYLPLLGDLNFRPGLNQLGYGVGNLSVSTSYAGVGYMAEGTIIPHQSNYRVSTAIKYIALSEMLPPDQYTSSGAAAVGRADTYTIDTRGLAIELRAQVALMNKVLLGLEGEGARLVQDTSQGHGQISYYNAQNRLYASIRVMNHRRLTLDVDADYYLRLTNLTDTREQKVIQFVGVGTIFGFRRR